MEEVRGTAKFDLISVIYLFIFQLWTQRIEAGVAQHGLSVYSFRDAMQKSNILLNRKVLSELAAWEPATFEAIAKIGKDVVDKEKEELDQKRREMPQITYEYKN